MPESSPKAGQLLSRYLAEQDAPCEGCGYNLRGVTTLFCPECGMVIPRPPHEAVAKLEGRADDLLWCPKCRYPLVGVPGDCCPECGHKRIRDTAPKKRRGGFVPGVPGPLLFVGALAAMELFTTFFQSLSSGRRFAPVIATLVIGSALVPVMLVVAFWLGRRRLDEMTAKGYWMLTGIATAVGLLCVFAAGRLI